MVIDIVLHFCHVRCLGHGTKIFTTSKIRESWYRKQGIWPFYQYICEELSWSKPIRILASSFELDYSPKILLECMGMEFSIMWTSISSPLKNALVILITGYESLGFESISNNDFVKFDPWRTINVWINSLNVPLFWRIIRKYFCTSLIIELELCRLNTVMLTSRYMNYLLNCSFLHRDKFWQARVSFLYYFAGWFKAVELIWNST